MPRSTSTSADSGRANQITAKRGGRINERQVRLFRKGVLSTALPIDPPKAWNPIRWSFLSLIIGVSLLIVSPQSMFVSVCLFLACFVLSAIAIANRRLASGVTMMILLFTAPAICVVVRNVTDGGKDIEKGVIKLEEQRNNRPTGGHSQLFGL
jgi:hypothetical protein